MDMASSSQDTIFALSSGAVPAGIAVIRLSGPHSRFVYETICGKKPCERHMQRASFRSEDGGVIDRGLATFFSGPDSFTGEDCAEFHLHGGRAVVQAMLRRLGETGGLRQAEAGEFTMRAFLNGKFDLTEAEALADLIEAETEEQRRFAIANVSEKHGALYEDWRQQVISIMALVETAVDFSDEEDTADALDETVWTRAKELAGEIGSHVEKYRSAEIIREGFRVAIIGAPNAGKSSLINALAQRDVAIVTEEPGTTRDVIEVDLDLGGMKVVVADTAGIRSAEGRVEKIGLERAIRKAQEADLVILMDDAMRSAGIDSPVPDAKLIRIGNKVDLMTAEERKAARSRYDMLLSVKDGSGIDALLEKIGCLARDAAGAPVLVPFRERHVAHLNACADALRNAAANSDAAVEVRAEELRRAADHLGRISGKVDVEDLLDAIFSRFCIGK